VGIKNVCAKEKVLQEELSSINMQLTALGQRLIELGYHLKENPAQIKLINCDINNPNSACTFSMNFHDLQECPTLVEKLLSSYHQLQRQLTEISSQVEDSCSD